MVDFSFNSTLAQMKNVCMQFSWFFLKVQNLQIKNICSLLTLINPLVLMSLGLFFLFKTEGNFPFYLSELQVKSPEKYTQTAQ